MSFHSLIFPLLAYCAGSIPFGLLLTKYTSGIDVREVGSGNIGATNVLRTGNKKLALATLFLDALKGFLPVYLCMLWGGVGVFPLITAFAAVTGHIFPIWLRFKGGKGVATALGVLLALNPYVCALTILCWLVVAKTFRISSLAALIAVMISPLTAYMLSGWDLSLFCMILAALLMWTHRENIKRLRTGAEGKF